jgi:quinohemoprotein amine dehydrogenase
MRTLSGLALGFSVGVLCLLAQQDASPKPKELTEAQKLEIESGIPIASEQVRKACSPCHTADEKLRMSRISWRRATPEGWEHTIKRMVELNGLQIEPAAARDVLRYLSNNLGLAPDEAQKAAFEAEKRMIDYHYPEKDVDDVCSKCHSLGRVISQRRSKSEWELLVAMHRGYYPYSDFQAFRRMGPPATQPGPDGRPPDNRHPMDKALPLLASGLPLTTPEWSAWAPNMGAPKLEGRWMFHGYQAGKGAFYGETTIRPGEREQEFVTETRYVSAKTGATLTRQGRAILYTGFQWRGRSFEGASKDGWREVMFLDRGRRELKGRWFTGGYDEIGIEVTMSRIGADPVISGLDTVSLASGGTREVSIFGANFPAGLEAAAIEFGRGVAVKRLIAVAADRVRVELEVSKDAATGPRDVTVAGTVKPAAITIYDKIDAIKVTPVSGMARVGGINYPKQLQQFEAVALHNGADGKPDTPDDLTLGPVNVTWSIEEFTATFDDTDKEYVGHIDDSGLFTPNVDGPNPKRRGNGNNVGDVWVIATYKTAEGRTLRARAHLLVTVPLYIRYDQPEVAQ